ncbi:hypothetical protein GCM10022408_38020 [Hymenobacter fastidiosus]|uniref:Uncharacterized protein n=1 Tax=Hymenobacter fastidiosus TaxID=486264 RepID=A0ABP7T5A3_9BACT
MSITNTTPAPHLTAYLTWSLGIDMPGLSVVYAADKVAARTLLDDFCANTQPKHKVFDTYSPTEVRRDVGGNAYGVHLLNIGIAPEGTQPHIMVIERGEDVRFDD